MDHTILTGIDQIGRQRWDDFLEGHPHGTIFQSPEMHDLFLGADKMEPLAVACEDHRGQLEGVLLAVILSEYSGIKGIISRRTVIYGGPLVREGGSADEAASLKETVVDLLLSALVGKVRRKSIFIQFRNFVDLSDYQRVFGKHSFRLHDRLNLLVKIRDKEQVRHQMSESRWRQVQKGLSSGAVIEKPGSPDEVRSFYEILYKLYKYKVKKPLPGWSFFEHFYQQAGQGKNGIILLVKYNKKVIGGILSPITPGKVIYEWYVCGLDQEYKHQYPSVVATWAAMDYAIRNGIPQFDFMGVGLPEKTYGVREFKKRFGGEIVNYGRYSRINNRFFYHIAELGYNMLALLRKI